MKWPSRDLSLLNLVALHPCEHLRECWMYALFHIRKFCESAIGKVIRCCETRRRCRKVFAVIKRKVNPCKFVKGAGKW